MRPPRAGEGDVRHVKGSHIVVPRIHPEAHAYILQNADHRIVFVIPYHDRYSLIGTTDIPVDAYEHPRDFRRRDGISAGARQRVSRTAAFADPTSSGPTAACGRCTTTASADPSAVTRDYVLKVDALDGAPGPERAPVLSIFGGKITTYRKLAEHVLSRARAVLSADEARLDAQRAVAGRRPAGTRPQRRGSARAARAAIRSCRQPLLRALAARHGTRALRVLGDAQSPADLGHDFGAQLTAREVDYLRAEEWATHGRRRAVAADQVRPADDAGAARCRRRIHGTSHMKRICLFCGSNVGARPAYAQAAGDLGPRARGAAADACLRRRQRRAHEDRRGSRARCGRTASSASSPSS